MTLPLAVHYRLDKLAELAVAVQPTRAEMVGMLIAEADLEADELEERLLRYRRMTVEDAICPFVSGDDSDAISIPLRLPGRPSRRRAT